MVERWFFSHEHRLSRLRIYPNGTCLDPRYNPSQCLNTITSSTAGYGTVRPVVWEDGGGNPTSYPIAEGDRLVEIRDLELYMVKTTANNFVFVGHGAIQRMPSPLRKRSFCAKNLRLISVSDIFGPQPATVHRRLATACRKSIERTEGSSDTKPHNPRDAMSSIAKHAEILAGRLASDEKLRKELKAHSRSSEEVEGFIKSLGYECTVLELRAALLRKYGLETKVEDELIRDSEMERVVGGVGEQSNQTDVPIEIRAVLNFHDFQSRGFKRPP